MTEREKVIKGLECAVVGITSEEECRKCPYQPYRFGRCKWDAMADALSLLKAQEPKPPIVKENNYGWKFFYCPSCGREFNANRKHGRMNEDNFCDKCGQAVKWDG